MKKYLSVIPLVLLVSVISCMTSQETKKISIEVHEGTELAFDLSPDGQTIVFDLLGQIWLLSVKGGEALSITDSIKENSEHLYPTFTADGENIVFWDSRPTGWGLTFASISGDIRKILTTVSSRIDDLFPACSPVSHAVAFVRQGKLFVAEFDGEAAPIEIPIDGIPSAGIADPAWSPDGQRLAFINARADAWSHAGGLLWQVAVNGGTAVPLAPDKLQTRSPAYSPDGAQIAYFALDEQLRYQLWIQNLDKTKAKRLTEHEHITPLCLRWHPSGNELIYCAEGRFWRIPSTGGQPKEIPFTAHLSVDRKQTKLKDVQFAEWEEERIAHGHRGLSISPDGEKIAAITLGKLWVWAIEEEPEIVSELPITAAGISWSPGSDEVVWSAGPRGDENLFITNVDTGKTRCLTELPGMEIRASWSPDGKNVVFIHRRKWEMGRPYLSVRVVQSDSRAVSEFNDTIEIHSRAGWGLSDIISSGLDHSLPWSPDSKSLVLSQSYSSYLIGLDGRMNMLKHSIQLPVVNSFQNFQYYGVDESVFLEGNNLLWRAPFDLESGVIGEAVPVSQDAAIYTSVSRDGTVLYISGDGLRLRYPDGQLRQLGWPIKYTTPQAPSRLSIHNVRIIDGIGSSISQPSDLLIEEGRIAKIAAAGEIMSRPNVQMIDAEGRVMIPGLIDAHIHIWDQSMLVALLYEGITAARDMGSEVAWIKDFQESIEAGLLAGPKLFMGGEPFLPDFTGSNDDPPSFNNGYSVAVRRVELARAFDFDFIKMYLPANAHTGNEFIMMAHEIGLPVSSHMAYPLPLLAAGIDTKEHLNDLGNTLGPRFGGVLFDDIIQLLKASEVKIVPTASMCSRQFGGDNGVLIEEANTSPFLSDALKSNLGPKALTEARKLEVEKEVSIARCNVEKFHRAGLKLAAGTDNPFYWAPWALHKELEVLVQSGLSPSEAIVAATQNAARVLRADKDIGTIEVGKLADLVILDENPLENIRNTRKIWKVIKTGNVVDRETLQSWIRQEAEETTSNNK